ncbi:hypothetical protein [Streptomyces acidicola]|nr:hypothetical protein [Streptomyces acidicola]
MQALRNANQRLMVENSRLIAADALEPTRTSRSHPQAVRPLRSLPPTDL